VWQSDYSALRPIQSVTDHTPPTPLSLDRSPVPWHRRLETLVAGAIALLIAVALGAVLLATTRLVTDRSLGRGSEDLAVARAAFSRLMVVRAQAVAAQVRLITAQAIFRSLLTEKPTAVDVGIMGTLADEFPRQLNAEFCIVTDRHGVWMAMPGWGDRGPSPPSLQSSIRSALQGDPQSTIVQIAGRLFLVVSEPARFAADTLGTMTVGLALDDRVARELAEITQSEVSLVAGRRLSGSSLQGAGRTDLERLLQSTDVRSPGPESLVLPEIGGTRYLTGTSPLTSLAGNEVVGQLVLLRDWAPTRQFIDGLKLQFARVGIIVFACALAGGLVFSRWMSRPFHDIAIAARDIAAGGHWTRQVEVRGSAEAMTMATAFNEMGTSLRHWHEMAQAQSEHLEESSQRFRSVTDSAKDAIVSTDEHGAITFWNRSAQIMFGYDEAEAMGKPLTHLVAPLDRQRYLDAFVSLARGEGGAPGSSIEMVGMRRDGTTYPIELSFSAWQRDGRTQVTAVIRDITDRKQAQEALRQRDIQLQQALRERDVQLQQAEKMEAIGRLAGGVAHDFNNLLTAIMGFGGLVRDHLLEQDPLRADIDEVLSAADRAATVTRQLLAFSRRQVVTPRIIALDQVVASTETMLRRLIGEDIILSSAADPALGRVYADPGQIEQILVNLVVNARDGMPDGGELRIDLRNVELDLASAASRHGLDPGRYVRLAVSDSGSGIEPDVISHIFEPFFTTKPDGKGTGLGMATVYGIAKQNGGYVEVESNVPQGTIFCVYFPRVDSIETIVSTGGTAASSERPSETVLLVEDDDRVRGLVAKVLGKRGYTVLVASRGDEALELVRTHPAPIHLLLCDVVMPGMSGRVVAARVTALRRDTRVLLMSGYSDDAVLRGHMEAAKMPFIRKPFSMDALAAKIREALGGPAIT
jgi:PAS domain S-box-containing protein